MKPPEVWFSPVPQTKVVGIFQHPPPEGLCQVKLFFDFLQFLFLFFYKFISHNLLWNKLNPTALPALLHHFAVPVLHLREEAEQSRGNSNDYFIWCVP